MAKDLTVTGFEDKPGVSAGIGEALGDAGVNAAGLTGSGTLGEIHVLIEDGDLDTARSTIERLGLKVDDARDALVVPAEDKPGAFGNIARKLANAGVNIDFHYIAANTRLVFVVDDIGKARDAID